MSMDKEAIQALLARGGMIMQPIEHPAGGLAVLIPEDYELRHLQKDHELPPFIKAQPIFTEMGSFIAYVNEYKDPGTKIFGDIDRGQLMAHLNYHQKSGAAHNTHVAFFSAKLSDEWNAWEKYDGSKRTQAEFAEFLEDHARTVQDPDAATLMEIVTTLEAKTEVTFQSKVKLTNGNQSLVFQENTEARGGGNLAVPAEFTLGIPVYQGGNTFAIRVFLRLKIDGGKACFTTKIFERERTKKFAFNQLCERAASEIDLPVLQGSTSSGRDYR